jgi:anti-sigma B factor antagonist
MLRIRERESCETAVVTLRGELVRAHCAELRSAIHISNRIKSVLLDFSNVTIIDAGGLGALLELRALTESLGINLELANVSNSVREILQITRLDSVFKIRIATKPRPRLRLVLSAPSHARIPRLVTR